MNTDLSTLHFITSLFPKELQRQLFFILQEHFITEIRLRINQPIILKALYQGSPMELTLNSKSICSLDSAYLVTPETLNNFLEIVTNYSLFSYTPQIKQGFITLRGGHRLGILGEAVFTENGKELSTLQNFTSLNLRIAHEIKDFALPTLNKLMINGSFDNTIIVSPPNCGKTTFLRDLVRLLSDGDYYNPYTIGLIDERNEITGSYKGVPQFDIGTRTDYMVNTSKLIAIDLLVRSMSPDIIALDELGTLEEVLYLKQALSRGVKFIATLHAETLADLETSEVYKNLLSTKQIKYLIFMDKDIGKQPNLVTLETLDNST